MDKEYEKEYIRNAWEDYFKNGGVFPRLKGLLSIAKHHPESGFKDVWKQLNRQLISLAKHESNVHNKRHFDNIDDVCISDFMMINLLLDFFHQTWGELYDDELIEKIKSYVKEYEKYIASYV